MSKIVLSLLVDNISGVLSRVAGLFSRRGYNIESITAGVASGDELILQQIENQLRKLEDVRDIKELKPEHAVCRELVMVKVKVQPSDRQAVISITDIFRGTIVDVGKESLTILLTGDQSKIEALLGLLGEYEILELARTGLTALSRGADDVRYLP